jgi:hypothetical protein
VIVTTTISKIKKQLFFISYFFVLPGQLRFRGSNSCWWRKARRKRFVQRARNVTMKAGKSGQSRKRKS